VKDPELEENLLSFLVSNPAHLVETIETLPEESFECYARFYKIIVGYYKRFKNIPSMDVMQSLANKFKDGPTFVELYSRLKSRNVNGHDFKFFLERFRDYSVGNTLLRTFDECVDVIKSRGGVAALEKVKKSVFVSQERTSRESDITENATQRMEEYLDRKNNPDKYKGVKCGLSIIDDLGGFLPGECVLIGAGTGGGKSVALLNFAYSAWKGGYNVAYFSLEMPKPQVEKRFDCRHTLVDYQRLKHGKLTPEEEGLYQDGLRKLVSQTNLFYVIDIPRTCTPLAVESKLATLPHHFDLVVVDYQGLMIPNKRSENDWESQGQVTAELRQIGRAYNCVVLTAIQITREGSKKEIATLTDVARSYLSVQHADIVILLGMVTKTPCEMAVVIDKHRDAASSPGKIYVDFNRMYMANLQQAGKESWEASI